MAAALRRSLLPRSLRLPPAARLAAASWQASSTAANAPLEVRVPTNQEASAMPRTMAEMSNDMLVILATMKNHGACEERLVREVMCVDQVEWVAAKAVVEEMDRDMDKSLWLLTLPHKVGFSVAAFAGFGSIPMVFHLDSAKWFNQLFVTQPLPEAEDLETAWEVGMWTWNWMEPALGTASFTLLAMQFMRAQMQNMNIKPYTEWVRTYRAKALAAKYPRYNRDIVMQFAKCDPLGK